ncbi:MAG: DUF975 family protein [Clostridiales bacterium]|nr:DUF975 family protein [Clostridiales bacterium]
MDRITIKEDAKRQISGYIGMFFIMTLIVSVITVVVGLIPVAGALLSFISTALFDFAFVMIFLALSQGIKPEYNDIFSIFKNTQLCGNALLLEILTMVFTFLWSLLFVVPGIIKGLSYAMAPYILAENDYFMTPSDAIKESMRIMNGHKLDLFVLNITFLGWFFASAVTFGLVGIYALPYYRATITNFYNEIKNKPETVL